MNTDENGWGMEVVLKALEWETSVPERKSTRTPFSLVQNMRVSPALTVYALTDRENK